MYMLIFLILCPAVFYYRLGESEYGRGNEIALISVFLSILILVVLGWGLKGHILAQVGLYVYLTIYNMRRPPKHF